MLCSIEPPACLMQYRSQGQYVLASRRSTIHKLFISGSAMPSSPDARRRLKLLKACSVSNLILTGEDGRIISCGRQVSDKMSRLRTLQTGSKYRLPPAQSGAVPSASEAFQEWRQRLQALHTELEPQWDEGIPLASLLVKAYRVCQEYRKTYSACITSTSTHCRLLCSCHSCWLTHILQQEPAAHESPFAWALLKI